MLPKREQKNPAKANKLYGPRDLRRAVPVPNEQSAYRSEFRRDYDRILHCSAFRRLQGKTQVFPHNESDFFRTRLTHSLEVSQIASSIAIRLNNTISFFKKNPIDIDLVSAASLAHDIGHPPFGHNGEVILNDRMRIYGGFEGNAQTFRILSRISKRSDRIETNDPGPVGSPLKNENRIGLNLTSRTLAAVLKYDREIDYRTLPTPKKLVKGYYRTERDVVERIKQDVLNGVSLPEGRKFKTIECQIMDLADDIAYSAFDLEDAFHGGFLDPLTMLSLGGDAFRKIVEEVKDSFLKDSDDTYDVKTTKRIKDLNTDDIIDLVADSFSQIFFLDEDQQKSVIELMGSYNDDDRSRLQSRIVANIVADHFRRSKSAASEGGSRTLYTSGLIRQGIEAVELHAGIDEEFPALTKVRLRYEERLVIETLKRLVFNKVINSARIQQTRFSGRIILDHMMSVFLVSDDDQQRDQLFKLVHDILPNDYRELLNAENDPDIKHRICCDFVAGMTDRFAAEFYERMFSGNIGSIYRKT